MKKRPLGITLIALFYAGGALFLLLGIIVGGNKPELQDALKNLSNLELNLFYVSIALALIIGIGLWLLLNWARYLVILHSVLGLISYLLRKESPLNFGMVTNLAIILYLFLSSVVKEAFTD